MAKKIDDKFNTRNEGDKSGFPMPIANYRMILVGFGIVVLGFILMSGGGSDNPDVFNEAIFSFRRITLAPIVVLSGLGFVFWAIMRKPKGTPFGEENN